MLGKNPPEKKAAEVGKPAVRAEVTNSSQPSSIPDGNLTTGGGTSLESGV